MIEATTILMWMLRLQPEAPWSSSFPRTAAIIAARAQEDPVEGNPEWTAALLTSIAWHESRFDPRAVNPDSGTRGLWQVSTHWARPFLLDDPETASLVALRLIRESFRVC